MINGFASEDATVVMGTAIDDALEGEIRVTVVATGLGNVIPTPIPAPVPAAEIKVIKETPVEIEPSYKEYDKPTAIRKTPVSSEAVSLNGQYDEEMLDIPAFLRRQAD